MPRKLDPAQEQLILARSLLWTPELDKLLRKWRKQVGKREREHLNKSRTLQKYHYAFGLPALLLSAVSSTMALAADNEDTNMHIIAGSLGITGTFLIGVQTFMSFADAAANHKQAANDFGSLYRNLDTMLLVPGPVRGDPITTLQSIRGQYDDIIRRAPNLAGDDFNSLGYEVVDVNKLPAPPSPDEVVINIPADTTGILEEALKDTPSSTDSSGLEAISELIANENHYDTSDEEHDVFIGFDLEAQAMRMNNPSMVALAAAQIASQREEMAQKSLQKSLRFELERLENHSESARKLIKRHTKKRLD